MITKEMKDIVKEIKIETVSDFGTFQELEAFSAELLNSSDVGNKLLALRIQNRLNQNPNYQDFTQRFKIEEEKAAEQHEKEITDKKQEIRHSNATANLESKKKEESKKVEEDRKAVEAFNKLTAEQQKMIIELEKDFKPEVQQELRSFLLNKEKSTPENFAKIMNKEIGNDVVKIEKSDDEKEFITTDEKTTTAEAEELSEKTEKATDVAFKIGNIDAAVVGASTMDAANVRVATNNTKESIEKIKNEGDGWRSKDELDKMEKQEKENYLKSSATQKFINLELEEILLKHNDKLSKLENANLNDEDKKNKINDYNEDLMLNIKKGLKENNVDLNNKDNREHFVRVIAQSGMDDKDINMIIDKLGLKEEYAAFKKLEQEIADEVDGPTPKQEEPKPEVKEKSVAVDAYSVSVHARDNKDTFEYQNLIEVRKKLDINSNDNVKHEQVLIATTAASTSTSNN